MEKVLGPQTTHIGGHRSKWSKIDNSRVAPRWKAYDSGNEPTSK
jgi:hypothetical protein